MSKHKSQPLLPTLICFNIRKTTQVVNHLDSTKWRELSRTTSALRLSDSVRPGLPLTTDQTAIVYSHPIAVRCLISTPWSTPRLLSKISWRETRELSTTASPLSQISPATWEPLRALRLLKKIKQELSMMDALLVLVTLFLTHRWCVS